MGKRSRKKAQQDQNIINPEEEKFRRQKKILNYTFSLKEIKPLTKNQEDAFHAYWGGKNLVLHGVAGSGKSYIALFLAMNDLLKSYHKRIVIVRSAVSTRDQGFLPGSVQDKMSMYENPYRDMIHDLLGRGDAYDLLKKKGNLEFMSTSYIRGLTLQDAIVIIDEVQNMCDHEINSVLTRIGPNCRVIVCGDFRQDDLKVQGRRNQESGVGIFLECAKRMRTFDMIEFGIPDIVRSGFVKEYIIARYGLKLV